MGQASDRRVASVGSGKILKKPRIVVEDRGDPPGQPHWPCRCLAKEYESKANSEVSLNA